MHMNFDNTAISLATDIRLREKAQECEVDPFQLGIPPIKIRGSRFTAIYDGEVSGPIERTNISVYAGCLAVLGESNAEPIAMLAAIDMTPDAPSYIRKSAGLNIPLRPKQMLRPLSESEGLALIVDMETILNIARN